MDVIFNCPHCEQELAVEASQAGTETACPSCGENIVIPDEQSPVNEPPAETVRNPIASSAEAKVVRHFKVPEHAKPAESLIEKPLAPLDVAAKEGVSLRVKTFKRTDCVEVGKDNFDQVVSKFLGSIGDDNVVSINAITYSHQDLASREWVSDFGVMIVYRG